MSQVEHQVANETSPGFTFLKPVDSLDAKSVQDVGREDLLPLTIRARRDSRTFSSPTIHGSQESGFVSLPSLKERGRQQDNLGSFNYMLGGCSTGGWVRLKAVSSGR